MIAGTDGALLAALIAEAGQGPSGARDLSNYTGQIVAWDEISGTNVVHVNGGDIPNMRVVASGIGLAYEVGDVVNITARGTQWFINGKVGAPGAGAGNQIASGDVPADQSTSSTTYTDLATFGPQVTVTIGSSRRALVLLSAFFQLVSNDVNYAGGWMGFTVTGASSIGVNRTIQAQIAAAGLGTFGSRAMLFTAADGLNAGVNTFTCKYRADNSTYPCTFGSRNITVIPF
ncbi:hypothetical protein [Amycolatopsis sp. FDAARGOS 1241]|uniref:hypothetical protein n=1 Tax=Amycolatopsis sp. FDAARGOS 1241 TaxID=2778070 RepID=UPI00194FCC41|nr:hypothetical protein [Amycolatopsis sp. FDAARGOS 1241]QRP48012.1 hypothetical protein I6J71_09045 [Amycolatopsis sp. FDAARGOS 1241]